MNEVNAVGPMGSSKIEAESSSNAGNARDRMTTHAPVTLSRAIGSNNRRKIRVSKVYSLMSFIGLEVYLSLLLAFISLQDPSPSDRATKVAEDMVTVTYCITPTSQASYVLSISYVNY